MFYDDFPQDKEEITKKKRLLRTLLMLGPKTMASMQACCFLHDSYGLCRSKRDVAFA